MNSSYFGLRDEVADLKTAISLLGFNEVRNLAMTVYVASPMRGIVGVSRLFSQPSVVSHGGGWIGTHD